MKMNKIITSIIKWLTVPALLALVVLTQLNFDRVRASQWRKSTVTYNQIIEPIVPNKDMLKISALGNNNFMADLLWLNTIQYYGGGDPYGKYQALPKLMSSILSLDNKFSYPYQFSGIVLSGEGFSDQALQILKDGEVALPNNWEIPYYEGTIYYINKKDYAQSAAAYKRASEKPGAPSKTKFLSAVEFDRSNDYQTALAIFEGLAESSDTQYFKDRAKLFVDHYTILQGLTNMIKDYKNKFGHYPKDLNELVQKHYLTEIPKDPLNRDILYDSNTGAVTSPVGKN
ncbi:MAG: hypothetical protein WC773_04095 [Patescibacteria group bacterium]|jgi:tetratricopeptide (TPR) repeat protein